MGAEPDAVRWRLADSIAWVERDPHQPEGEEVFVCVLPGGPITVLSGTGSLIWLALVESDGTLWSVVAGLVEAGYAAEDIPEEGVRDFLTDLVAAGLLVVETGGG